MFSIGAMRDCALSGKSRRVPSIEIPIWSASHRGEENEACLESDRDRKTENIPAKKYWGEGAL